MPQFDINAYNKLNTVFNYAQQLKASRTASGGATVVRLQDGDAFTCNYSTADAPRGLFNPASRSQTQKNLNNETRAVFKQAVIDIFGTSINDVPKNVRSAMNLSDYNCGKPLTARRIIAVEQGDRRRAEGLRQGARLHGRRRLRNRVRHRQAGRRLESLESGRHVQEPRESERHGQH